MNYDFADTTIADTATPAACGRAQHAEPAPAGETTGAADTPTSAARNAPLRGHRAQLAELNAQLAAAVENLRRSQTPPARLHALINDLQHAEQTMISQRSQYDGEVGRWIANGCAGDRPTPSRELDDAERNLAQAAEDGRAARHMLPQAEAAVGEAAALVGQLTQRRDEAHRQVILQIVDECVEQRLVPALRAAQLVERQIWQIADALHQRGDAAAVARIREQIGSIKTAQLAPSASLAEGMAFIHGLLSDPGAELGADA
jgi:hypothetical protein